MTGGRSPRRTLGDALDETRRRTFVGRAAERELVRTAFAADDAPYAVVWLTGPGGIGKSSLLDVLRDDAIASGARVAEIDGRHVPPAPAAIERCLVDVLDDAEPADGDRIVLLVDAYERLGQLDEWFREVFLPGLPASTVVVIAGRHPPAPRWRADPAWRDTSREIALRNLSPDEAHDFLERSGVDAGVRDRLLELSHGHPLGLSLLADVVERGGEIPDLAASPNLVEHLLGRFVDVTPSVEHRRALEVCALARVTDEALLRAVIGRADADTIDDTDAADVHATFEWLRSLSFVGRGRDGVVPHDLARDVLDADLRWRDPAEYARVFRAVRRHVHGRLRAAAGSERRAAAFDLKFLFRNLPSVLSPVDWETWGAIHPEPARPDDHVSIVELIEHAEGHASAAIARRWLAAQPDGFHVVRRDDGTPRGVVGLIDLCAADAADLAADPGARAAWSDARRSAPPRSGETITQARFIVDRDEYQAPSPTINATPVVTLLHYLDTPHLARDYLTLHDPDQWDPFFELADFPRVQDADFEVEGRRYGLFCHDFRWTPVDALIELWTERALAQDPTLRPVAAATLVLSRSDFADAVKQGLRDLHRPEALAANPLTRTRLVSDSGPGEQAAALAGLLRDAVTSLGDDPRETKFHRAVDRTYVRAATTQEAAAEILDLPFSTYRRHLARGVERVVDRLWERELYGRSC